MNVDKASNIGYKIIIVVLALTVVVLAVVVSGVVSTSPSQKHTSPQACFVTGNGAQLCGAAAGAYCDLHYTEYLVHDHASARQCDATFPARHCAIAAMYHKLSETEAAKPYIEPGCNYSTSTLTGWAQEKRKEIAEAAESKREEAAAEAKEERENRATGAEAQRAVAGTAEERATLKTEEAEIKASNHRR